MDPLDRSHETQHLPQERSGLAFAGFVGLLTGLGAGYQAGYTASLGGLSGGAAFIMLMVAGATVLLVAVGIGAGMTRRPTLRLGAFVAAGMLVLGTVAGNVAVSAFGLGYRPPVVLEADGTGTLTLTAVDGFVGVPGGPLSCASEPDGTAVEQVTSDDLGELRFGTLRAFVRPPVTDSDQGSIELFVVVSDPPSEWVQPVWTGGATFDAAPDGGSGTARFVGLAIQSDPKAGTADPAWPSTLSGTFAWACEPWRPASATSRPSGPGDLSLELEGLTLERDRAGSVTCDYEAGGSTLSVAATRTARLQDWPLEVSVSLDGPRRVGGDALVAIATAGREVPPGLQFRPNWVAQTTIVELGAGKHSGSLTFEEMPSGVDPSIGQPPAGWPPTLSGSISWRCP